MSPAVAIVAIDQTSARDLVGANITKFEQTEKKKEMKFMSRNNVKVVPQNPIELSPSMSRTIFHLFLRLE